MRGCCVAGLMIGILCAAGISAASPIYSVRMFVTPGPGAYLHDLNNLGQASGNVPSGPFVASTSGYELIPPPPGLSQARVFGINDSGQVAGWADTPAFTRRAFIGTAFGSTLIPLPPEWSVAQILSINNSGQVAVSGSNWGTYRAFVGTTSGSLPIPSPPGWSVYSVGGINNSGQVAGTGWHGSTFQAFIGTTSGSLPIPLPPGWSSAYGADINDSGQVAGGGRNGATANQAFIGTLLGSTPIPFMAGSSWAMISQFALNNAGQVVGYGAGGGWIWDAVNGTRPLDELVPAGWHMSNAMSINDRGQILAYGWTSSWNGHVLLDSVPEPMTGPVLGSGLILLAALARRKRYNPSQSKRSLPG